MLGGREGLCEVTGVPFVVSPKLSSLQLSLSQLAASPPSPAPRHHSAKPSSQPPGSPVPSLVPGVSSPPLPPVLPPS